MREFISNLFASFPRCGPRVSRSRIPTIGDNGDEETNLYSTQATIDRAAEEAALENTDARFTLDHLSRFRIQADTINFNSTQPHALGGKAKVIKAALKRGKSDEQEVAVKKLQYHNETNKEKFSNEFVREVDVMAQLSHDNIVKLIGFVEELHEGDWKAWIIMAWEPNGNVSEFLATGDWEIPERVSLIQDTFAGLECLHTRQPPICHGDMKSLNILVSASCRAIITDFGSARAMGETEERPDDVDHAAPEATRGDSTTAEYAGLSQITLVATNTELTLTGPAWSLRWAAPEIAMGKRQNLASDIWAAGWVCWEIMTNKVPFPELNAEGVITLKVVQGE
ncbi:hypothetical protein FRC01_010492, partial [Tulasnella sp. 417]